MLDTVQYAITTSNSLTFFDVVAARRTNHKSAKRKHEFHVCRKGKSADLSRAPHVPRQRVTLVPEAVEILNRRSLQRVWTAGAPPRSPSLVALKVLSGVTYMINARRSLSIPFRASAVQCMQQGADRSPDKKNIPVPS